ncbi:MAG: NUDIX hydrolase [Lentisphaeraceae bacterium]|nr:NUDIX hydrolase [Lentisphaeraceae bacterium]
MSRLVRTVIGKPWIPYENKVEFHIDFEKQSFDAPITTVHGFIFDSEKRLLMVRHKTRGWEIPGGHIDDGESDEKAMHRELYEESQVKVKSLFRLGYLKKIATGSKPEKCDYPYPLSYCSFFAAELDSQENFVGDESIVDYRFMSLKEAHKTKWIMSYKDYLDAALSLESL